MYLPLRQGYASSSSKDIGKVPIFIQMEDTSAGTDSSEEYGDLISLCEPTCMSHYRSHGPSYFQPAF